MLQGEQVRANRFPESDSGELRLGSECFLLYQKTQLERLIIVSSMSIMLSDAALTLLDKVDELN